MTLDSDRDNDSVNCNGSESNVFYFLSFTGDYCFGEFSRNRRMRVMRVMIQLIE